MKERPILFSGPMVRALLDGTKTQTRRIVTSSASKLGLGYQFQFGPSLSEEALRKSVPMRRRKYEFIGHIGNGTAENPETEINLRCPYGIAGDRLWVKETFALESNAGFRDVYDAPENPLGPVRWIGDFDEYGQPIKYFECARYRASEPDTLLVQDVEEDEERQRWKPSIFMFRWMSRITLEVVSIRIERLQEISEVDAIAEGIELLAAADPADMCRFKSYISETPLRPLTAYESYRSLWRSINGPTSWDANPWVWCVQFKRLAAYAKSKEAAP